MSEQGEKPEVLPGDLITRPGLYQARCGEIVPITGWEDGWWITEWDGVRSWYASNGRQRFYEGPDADEWQLLHWVGPLPATKPELQPEPQPQPVQVREGRWRTRAGDIRNVTPTPEGDGRKERYPWWDAQWHGSWTADGRYHFGAEGPLDLVEHLGPIEQQPQPESQPEKLPEGCRNDGGWSSVSGIQSEPWPEPEPQPEQKPQAETEAQPETQPQPIQVREGLWRQADGGAVAVRPTIDSPSNSWKRDRGYVWSDGARLYLDNGRHSEHETTKYDLVEYLGPIQRQSEPQPKPVQVREGRWRTRGGDIRNVTQTPEGDGREHSFPWWDAQYRQTWTSDGRYHFNCESRLDLVEYLGPIEEQSQPVPQPEPESDAELRIRLLKEANNNQAETIGQLKGEARDLNMEIGGLERQLLQRDARIRDLETMHAAAAQAVVDAGKQNDALRLQVQNRQQEYERQKGRIQFLETLDAGNAVAICDYIAKVAKLQGLVDTARGQLEAAATERDELRAAIDQCDKQLDQKDTQIRDLRIELDAAQQVPRPVGDEERERIWDEATEQAGRQVMRWLRPMIAALNKQPNDRFQRFMALTLSVLPDLLPELLGYAVEDESLDTDEDGE